ncbi:MAG: hypothetical protein K2N86_06205 [Rikenellaceae bacterium]|nr:hypothetical protein [Rikenellaceae bacterium]MDE7355253.1 hypothetical protein [Rikenellaceae bacterium]
MKKFLFLLSAALFFCGCNNLEASAHPEIESADAHYIMQHGLSHSVPGRYHNGGHYRHYRNRPYETRRRTCDYNHPQCNNARGCNTECTQECRPQECNHRRQYCPADRQQNCHYNRPQSRYDNRRGGCRHRCL